MIAGSIYLGYHSIGHTVACYGAMVETAGLTAALAAPVCAQIAAMGLTVGYGGTLLGLKMIKDANGRKVLKVTGKRVDSYREGGKKRG